MRNDFDFELWEFTPSIFHSLIMTGKLIGPNKYSNLDSHFIKIKNFELRLSE